MVWDSEFRVGDLILDGRYRIEALIARGRYGEVYRVRHLELRVDRVLKIVNLPQGGAGDVARDELRAHFQTEAQLGARLDDPHVLRVHELEEAGDRLFLVEEYAAGGSLAARLAGGPLAISEAVRITQDVANGLQVLHEQRVVHSNVTPASILLDETGRAKIADLGWSQSPWSPAGEPAAGDATAAGDAAYESPEQLEQVTYLTPSADVYGLGCVLFEMLTGWKYQQARRQRKTLLDLRPDVPPALETAVERMLREERGRRPADAADPRKRYPSMADVLDALDDESAPVQRLPNMPRAQKSAPLLLLVLLIVACLVIAGAGVVWIYNPLYRLVASVETPAVSATATPGSTEQTQTPQSHPQSATALATAWPTRRPSVPGTVTAVTESLTATAVGPTATVTPGATHTPPQVAVRTATRTATTTRAPTATATSSVTPLPTWTSTPTATPHTNVHADCDALCGGCGVRRGRQRPGQRRAAAWRAVRQDVAGTQCRQLSVGGGLSSGLLRR